MKNKDPSMQILPNDSIVQLLELKNCLFSQNVSWKKKCNRCHLSFLITRYSRSECHKQAITPMKVTSNEGFS